MRMIGALLLLVGGLVAAAYVAAQMALPKPLPDEQAIAEIVDGAVAELLREYPEGQNAKVRRDAHAKAHGCVKAIFRTDPDLPEALRVGTFSLPGQRFKALVRFSNGALHPGPDAQPDGRGMAIKLIDADPEKPDADRRRPPHDILMVNHPVFFLANLQDYRVFMRSGALRGGEADLKAYFKPGWNPFSWRLRQASIAIANATQKIASPLRSDYFSMTPYAFGPGRAVKYAARPCAAASGAPADLHNPDYLRAALQSELARAPACFQLFAQERTGDIDIDDATQDWPQALAPFRRIGQLDIPAQAVDAAGRERLCENLSYNPGHAPTEQAPLGGINRGRAKVYERIAAYRMERNGVTPTDAEKAWDAF